jgi:exodeoxyribonuclease-1
MAYIFYDTETTGTNTAFDQILQFAAIKTDDELNVVETFNVRCRLLPYVVPAPGALLVTGTTVADITTCPLSHFEMMRQVHAKMHHWSEGGAVFVGFNSMRFDETLLRQAYYQTLLPVYQTNTNGNGRADMMRMARVVAACAPNVISVPLQADGNRTFKLGLVAAANNIALDNAHDALADTSATLGVARLIRQRAPELWDALILNARKAGVLKLIQNDSIFLLSESHSNTPSNFVVAAVARNPDNQNEWATFDLQFDPAPYLDANDDDLRAAIDGTIKAIRRLSINSQPGLLPIDFAQENVQGGRLSLEIYQARAKLVREHATFRRRIAHLMTERFADRAGSIHIEEQIYSGFPTNADQIYMHSFHQHDWSERTDIVQSIEDRRFREFGRRIIATERPDLLTNEQRLGWTSWCHDRLLSNKDVPWLTVSTALEELAMLPKNVGSNHQNQLLELERFLKKLGR